MVKTSACLMRGNKEESSLANDSPRVQIDYLVQLMKSRGEKEEVDEFGILGKDDDKEGDKAIEESEVPWKRQDWGSRVIRMGL